MAFQVADSYAALAARLPEREWAAVHAYVAGGRPVGLPAYVAPNASPLEAARAIAARYPSILEDLRLASDASYAWTEAKPDGGAIERLAAFVVSTAHVRFAEGKRQEATTLLIDGLTLARRVGDGAVQTLVFDAIRRDKDAIPLSGCERIRAAADAFLTDGLKTPVRREIALLRLRMRIEAYRWRYGKPPERLADAAPVLETLDPTTRTVFAYAITGADYRLGDAANEG